MYMFRQAIGVERTSPSLKRDCLIRGQDLGRKTIEELAHK